ncbi:uncharacterized protein EDB91DRAFT_1133175 [Suillus paluster]|uniref:uncharacterized protein n=1 Tax=Suillus paluster TaxID=48578 RepID=UPI001B86ABC6|nr:uncharacterized protein EDB91DRAFT_1133175 [Suillus paluster]KAG1740107.1 hypothetical protein EDB91DRAFT_1133175 [Suillus paluster]
MRFSFLLAVVTALTTSISVSAMLCIDKYGACRGPPRSLGDKPCCKGTTCKLDVSMSRPLWSGVQPHDPPFASCTNSL